MHVKLDFGEWLFIKPDGTSVQKEYDRIMQPDKVLTLLFIGNPSEYTQQPVKVTPCEVSR